MFILNSDRTNLVDITNKVVLVRLAPWDDTGIAHELVVCTEPGALPSDDDIVLMAGELAACRQELAGIAGRFGPRAYAVGG